MSQEAFDFFSDEPISAEAIITLAEPLPVWQTVGGPIALGLFFILLCFLLRWFIPFKDQTLSFSLQDLPVAAQRGIGMAAVLFGVAFFFGIAQAINQVEIHGSTEAYFQSMTKTKLLTFTHAHLFGFTTAFFIIGIPFSMHFNRVRLYQWMFPAGLAAALTDIMSWWGIKYISPNFDYVTMACGVVYGGCYLVMLIGVIRIMFFPSMRWLPDYINESKQ